jgi:hypothetical protein
MIRRINKHSLVVARVVQLGGMVTVASFWQLHVFDVSDAMCKSAAQMTRNHLEPDDETTGGTDKG